MATTNSYWPSNESWYRYWPAGAAAAIATIQLLVSFAVVGMHCGIVTIGITVLCWKATSWVIMGFVCWLVFLSCWISVFCVTCCNRASPACATYVLVKNILAFVFSAVLIDFDKKLIDGKGPISFWTENELSCLTNLIDISLGTQETSSRVLLGLTKGQLAGSVLILVSALAYVGVYIYVYIRAVQANGRASIGTTPNFHPAGAQHMAYVTPVTNFAEPVRAMP